MSRSIPAFLHRGGGRPPPHRPRTARPPPPRRPTGAGRVQVYLATRKGSFLNHARFLALALACLTARAAFPCDANVIVPGDVYTYTLSVPDPDANSLTNRQQHVIWHDAPASSPAEDPDVIRSTLVTDKSTAALELDSTPRALGDSNPRLLSEIIADKHNVYFVNKSGLVARPLPGSLTLLSTAVQGVPGGQMVELAQDDGHVYALTPPQWGIWFLGYGHHILRVRKSDGYTQTLYISDEPAHDLQADGRFVYWVTLGRLLSFDLTNSTVAEIAAGVTGYHAEGLRVGRVSTRNVFIGIGPEILRYDSENLSSALLYTSSSPGAEIYTVTSDSGRIFFFERVAYSDPNFTFYSVWQHLVKLYRDGSGWQLVCSRWSSLPAAVDIDHLSSDGQVIYWQCVDRVEGLRIVEGAKTAKVEHGDLNEDGRIDFEDYDMLAQYLFDRGSAPHCQDAADASADGRLDEEDLVVILELIEGRREPVQPPAECPAEAEGGPEDGAASR